MKDLHPCAVAAVVVAVSVLIAVAALIWLAWRHPERWHPEIGDEDQHR